MRLTKAIVTCPVCTGSFFGAVIQADKQSHDAICPRCKTRFEVAGFLGRLSNVIKKDLLRLGKR